MDENLGEFSLEFQKPLEPLQLVRHGRKKGPLGRSLRTVKVDQHGKAMDDKSTNVPPRSDFCVDYKTGNIIPSLSTGFSTYTAVKKFPEGFRINPEQLWKLQKMTSYDKMHITQMYPKEVEFNEINENHFGIRPVDSVKPETFRQILRCLPWEKIELTEFEEARRLDQKSK